jgi:8-oxo-dGTP pyrophosphatase MutT (NUDIX family)
MYEVFFYSHKLVIAGLTYVEAAGSEASFKSAETKEQLRKIVEQFLNHSGDMVILTRHVNRMWKNFRSMFHEVPAAGGVVRSEAGFLFIYRRGRWDLPKGKAEAGESYASAALRETQEETGLKGLQITSGLPSTWHIYRDPFNDGNSRYILKETRWYLMQGSARQELLPEAGEDIEIARWFRADALDEVLSNTYASLAEMVRGMVNF